MISLQSADKYSSCLSCGSDTDVHSLVMRNPHSCNTLEVTLCRSCLLALVGQMQSIGITSECTKFTNLNNYSQKASDDAPAKFTER